MSSNRNRFAYRKNRVKFNVRNTVYHSISNSFFLSGNLGLYLLIYWVFVWISIYVAHSQHPQKTFNSYRIRDEQFSVLKIYKRLCACRVFSISLKFFSVSSYDFELTPFLCARSCAVCVCVCMCVCVCLFLMHVTYFSVRKSFLHVLCISLLR